MPKLCGTAKLVGNSFSCIHPLQRTALRKGFVAKLPASRGSDTVEQISKCVVRNANDCINLAEFTLREIPSPSELPSQTTASDLALGCLSSTGITALTLTQDFAVIGAHACDNCHLLKKVDLSNTQIEETQEFTFVHCTSLKEVSLPPTLHTIRVKAFMNCAVLSELAIPPSLKYTA